MRIILHENNARIYGPAFLIRELKKGEFPRNRTGKIIEILEKYPIFKGTLRELGIRLINLKNGEVLRIDENNFLFGCEPTQSWWHIIDVDTNRPWAVELVGDVEHLIYLDEYKVIDRELNFHGYRGNLILEENPDMPKPTV